MKVLICGAGIAGLTLAWWLARGGHDVDVVERAPGLRSDGYMIDFFGSGWDVAERMGLLEKLETIHYPVPELVFVDESGHARVRWPYPRLRKALFNDRHFNFMRGDLERALFEALPAQVRVRFGASLTSLADADGYDLLVGADGVHSKVRRLAFDANEAVRFLGFYAAAYVIEDASLAKESAGAVRTLSVPRRQVAVYPIRGGKVATFFVHDATVHPSDVTSPREILRRVFGDVKWIVPTLLDHLPADDDIFFDSVDQVVLDRWSRPRITLVGDACQAVSLLAGQGASMAMGGAWALARELGRGGSLDEALARYEALVKPAIVKKQRAGQKMVAWFAPAKPWRIAVRDAALRASALPGMSWIVRRSIAGSSIVS